MAAPPPPPSPRPSPSSGGGSGLIMSASDDEGGSGGIGGDVEEVESYLLGFWKMPPTCGERNWVGGVGCRSPPARL